MTENDEHLSRNVLITMGAMVDTDARERILFGNTLSRNNIGSPNSVPVYGFDTGTEC